ILYHELISHIAKGIRDEEAAMRDTNLTVILWALRPEVSGAEHKILPTERIASDPDFDLEEQEDWYVHRSSKLRLRIITATSLKERNKLDELSEGIIAGLKQISDEAFKNNDQASGKIANCIISQIKLPNLWLLSRFIIEARDAQGVLRGLVRASFIGNKWLISHESIAYPTGEGTGSIMHQFMLRYMQSKEIPVLRIENISKNNLRSQKHWQNFIEKVIGKPYQPIDRGNFYDLAVDLSGTPFDSRKQADIEPVQALAEVANKPDRLFSDVAGRIGFNKRELILTPHLKDRVKIRRSPGRLELIDVEEETNRLTLEVTPKGLMFVLPVFKDRPAQQVEIDFSRYPGHGMIGLSEHPLIIEFVIRLFWMSHKKDSLTAALMGELRKLKISYDLQVRNLLWQEQIISLPRFYEEMPGTIRVYRDSERGSYLLALEEVAHPDNFIIFLRKGNEFYIMADVLGADTLIPHRKRSVYPLETTVFEDFDLHILRPNYKKVKGGSNAASLGQASIGFSSRDEVLVERREGAITRKAEWARDKIIMRNPTRPEEIITVITRIGKDIFTVDGIAFSDGKLVPVKADRINLSTLTHSFPSLVSSRLRDYFSPTDCPVGDPDRLVAYEFTGKMIVRKERNANSDNRLFSTILPALGAVGFLMGMLPGWLAVILTGIGLMLPALMIVHQRKFVPSSTGTLPEYISSQTRRLEEHYAEPVVNAYKHLSEKLNLGPQSLVVCVGSGYPLSMATHPGSIPWEELFYFGLRAKVQVYEPDPVLNASWQEAALSWRSKESLSKAHEASGKIYIVPAAKARFQYSLLKPYSADAVVMMSVLSDYEDISYSARLEIFSEALKILKPDGYLIIGGYADSSVIKESDEREETALFLEAIHALGYSYSVIDQGRTASDIKVPKWWMTIKVTQNRKPVEKNNQKEVIINRLPFYAPLKIWRNIRPAGFGDIKSISKLYQEVLDTNLSFDETMEELETTWVYESWGRIKAFIKIEPNANLRKATISFIAVEKNARRKGIAYGLVLRAVKEMTAKGYLRITFQDASGGRTTKLMQEKFPELIEAGVIVLAGADSNKNKEEPEDVKELQDPALKEISCYSIASVSDENLALRRIRVINFYNALFALLARQGVFEGQTLIYPASGVDILPGRYANTVVLNEDYLLLAARRIFGNNPEYEKYLRYPDGLIDANRVDLYENYTGPITTAYKAVLLKGCFNFLAKNSSSNFLKYLGRLDTYLSLGDRIIILDETDRIQGLDYLLARGYRVVGDWLPIQDMESLNKILKNMRSHLQENYIQERTEEKLLVPNTLVILEKTRPSLNGGKIRSPGKRNYFSMLRAIKGVLARRYSPAVRNCLDRYLRQHHKAYLADKLIHELSSQDIKIFSGSNIPAYRIAKVKEILNTEVKDILLEEQVTKIETAGQIYYVYHVSKKGSIPLASINDQYAWVAGNKFKQAEVINKLKIFLNRLFHILLPLGIILASAYSLRFTFMHELSIQFSIIVTCIEVLGGLIGLFLFVENIKLISEHKPAKFFFGIGKEIKKITSLKKMALTRLADEAYVQQLKKSQANRGSVFIKNFSLKILGPMVIGAVVTFEYFNSASWLILAGALFGVFVSYAVSTIYNFLYSGVNRYKFRSEFVKQYFKDDGLQNNLADRIKQIESKFKFLAPVRSLWNDFTLNHPVLAGMISLILGKFQVIFWCYMLSSAVIPFIRMDINRTSYLKILWIIIEPTSWEWGYNFGRQLILNLDNLNFNLTLEEITRLGIIVLGLVVLSLPRQFKSWYKIIINSFIKFWVNLIQICIIVAIMGGLSSGNIISNNMQQATGINFPQVIHSSLGGKEDLENWNKAYFVYQQIQADPELILQMEVGQEELEILLKEFHERAGNKNWNLYASQIRELCVFLLGQKDNVKSRELLNSALNDSDKDVRTMAIVSLSRNNDKVAMSLLGDVLFNRGGEVQEAAILSLSDVESSEVTNFLLRSLKDDSHSDIRYAAVRALAGRVNLPEVEEALIYVFKNYYDPLAQQQVAFSLVDNINSPEVESFFIGVLYDNTAPLIQQQAMLNLEGKVNLPEVEEAFIYALKYGQDPLVRQQAVNNLASRVSSAKVEKALIYSLEYDSDSSVRQQAALSLAGINNLSVRNIMLSALVDSDPLVKQVAIMYVAPRADDAVMERIRQFVSDPDSGVRQAAILALGTRLSDFPENFELIRSQLIDPDSEIRLAAVLSLGPSMNEFPELKQPFLDIAKDALQPVEIRQNAMTSLSVVNTPEVESLLVSNLDNIDWQMRQSAALGLGNFTDIRIPDLLEPLVQDPQWQVRQATALSLGNFDQPQTIDYLKPLLND
ncbi:MAG TPA: HEAT repeat domain-containing protein, partial [Candidatus Omnitrophota bacterium]|nr:HEAT repeat domain-containing protein [Candidatus Omnitrophota bacterium]